MNNIKNKLMLIFDMDEVIYDLSDLIRKHVNHDFNKSFPSDFNKSYWWGDYNVPKPYFENLLQQKGIFYNGNPIKDSIEIITKLHEENYDIHICTRPQINQYCFFEKVQFIKKYLPFINIDTNFHTSGNKGLFASENRILIDDDISHLDAFANNNGISIAFGDYGWNQEWKGLRGNNFQEIYKIIHELSDIKDNINNIDVNAYRNFAYNLYDK